MVLRSRLCSGRLLDIGVVECELTDRFSNPVIFQCGLEKKKQNSTYEVKKAQGILLVNEFSWVSDFPLVESPGKSLQKRGDGSLMEETALHAYKT